MQSQTLTAEMSLTPAPIHHATLLLHVQYSAGAAAGQRRFLNVHEYISMDLMKQYGVSLPQGRVATTAAAAEAIATEMLHGRKGAYAV